MGPYDAVVSALSVRALMFTDVEGSTALVRRLGECYEEVLDRQQVLIRVTAAAQSGEEQSREGDSLFFTFPSATAALATAVDAQCRLEQERWPPDARIRVRIGLHIGEVADTRAGLVGLAIHRAARIMSAAHGGQIVVSGDVVQHAGRLPADTTVRALGTYELRDVGPSLLYQVEHPELQDEFPQLRTRRAAAHNLPAPLTSLVGRVRETSSVISMLSEHRLVTLLGAGGAGKTRMALEVADMARGRFVDGVWFVDLASVVAGSEVTSRVAMVLGVRGGLDEVVTALEDREALVVLDNCEHVLDPVVTLVTQVLRECATTSVLATSRAPLELDGEARYHVPPLQVPRRGAPISEAAATDAVQLFITRARLARADFTLDESDAEAIVELCVRLDGLPLAIELAAAQLRAMSLAELVSRIKDPFEVLVGGPRSAPVRHKTLHNTIEWSFRLLSGDEEHVLQGLASFRGGCSAESAEAVCGADLAAPASVLQLLIGLVDKSLVTAREIDGATRYELHETIREFASGSCSDADREAIGDRHARWFAVLASRLGKGPEAGGEQAWIAHHDVERDNFRAAALWLMVHDPPAALRLLLDIEPGIDLTAQSMWCYELIEQVLPLAAGSPAAYRAHALAELAMSTEQPGEAVALAFASDALELLKEVDDPATECAVRAAVARCRADASGGTPDEREIAAAVAAGDRAGGTYWPVMVRRFLSYRAPPAMAESLCADALRITEQLGLDHFGARLQRDLATIALFCGDGSWALATYREFAAILDADNSCFYALAEGEHGELAVGIHVAEHLSVELVSGPHDPNYAGELHAVVAHLRRLAGDPDGCELALNLADRTLAGDGGSSNDCGS